MFDTKNFMKIPKFLTFWLFRRISSRGLTNKGKCSHQRQKKISNQTRDFVIEFKCSGERLKRGGVGGK